MLWLRMRPAGGKGTPAAVVETSGLVENLGGARRQRHAVVELRLHIPWRDRPCSGHRVDPRPTGVPNLARAAGHQEQEGGGVARRALDARTLRERFGGGTPVSGVLAGSKKYNCMRQMPALDH